MLKNNKKANDALIMLCYVCALGAFGAFSAGCKCRWHATPKRE